MPVKKVGSEKPMKAKRVGDLVEQRIGPGGGVDADRDRDQQRQQLRRADHIERGRQALQDQRVHVHPADKGKAPVALQPSPRASAGSADRSDHRGRTWPAARGPLRAARSDWSPVPRTGSPGASASTMNRTSEMPSRLGTAIKRRRRIYWLMRERSCHGSVLTPPGTSPADCPVSLAQPLITGRSVLELRADLQAVHHGDERRCPATAGRCT